MWTAIRNWFRDSEVIVLARLSFFAGVLGQIVVTVDPSPFISDARWMLVWQVGAKFLVASGILTELAQRSRNPFTPIAPKPDEGTQTGINPPPPSV